MKRRKLRLRRIVFLILIIGLVSGVGYSILMPPPGGGNPDFGDGIYVSQGWFTYFVSVASAYGKIDYNTPYRSDTFGVKPETFIDYYIYAYDPDNSSKIYVWRFHKLKDQDIISVDYYHGDLEGFDRGLINNHYMDIQTPAKIYIYSDVTGIWLVVNGGFAGILTGYPVFWVSGVIKDGFMYKMDDLYPADIHEFSTTMIIVYTNIVEMGSLPFPGNDIYQVDYVDLRTHRHLVVSIPDAEKPYITTNETINNNVKYLNAYKFVVNDYDYVELFDSNKEFAGTIKITRLENKWMMVYTFKNYTNKDYYIKPPPTNSTDQTPSPELNVNFPEYRKPPDWKDLGGWWDYVWYYALPQFWNSIVNAFSFLGYIQSFAGYVVAVVNVMGVVLPMIFVGSIAFTGIMSLLMMIEGEPHKAIRIWMMYIQFIMEIIKLIYRVFKGMVKIIMKLIDVLSGPLT